MEYIDYAFWMIGVCISLGCGALLVLYFIGQIIILGNRLQHRFVDHVGGIKFCREFQKWSRDQERIQND